MGERDEYQEWANLGGCPTNDVCGSPHEPGHEIYGPYHRLPDGTFRCQIHFERELIARLAEAEKALGAIARIPEMANDPYRALAEMQRQAKAAINSRPLVGATEAPKEE